jgi:hypothetical protein
MLDPSLVSPSLTIVVVEDLIKPLGGPGIASSKSRKRRFHQATPPGEVEHRTARVLGRQRLEEKARQETSWHVRFLHLRKVSRH